jgi:K+-sensing histidine kinase KdpD
MKRDRLPEGPDDRLVVAGLGLAALGPLVVASLLVTVRDHMARSNAALVFVIVVVLAAALGGRWAGVTAAVISAMSYDFFLTRPYGSLKIDELEDIVATVLLLAVGLIVGEVVVWAHRGHRQKKRGQDEITRLHRVAEQVAAGASARDVLESVRAELTDLLSLRACTFEQPPFGTPLPRLGRNGSIDIQRRFSDVAGRWAASYSSRTPMSGCRSRNASSPSRSPTSSARRWRPSWRRRRRTVIARTTRS